MNELHMPTFPLDGVRLIEASAGTGKTYTIANLYLRLVLERGMDVPQILVVTFTKAATEELRDRIRRRLREARDRLARGALEDDGDLGTLLRQAAGTPEEIGNRLEGALADMDEAAVFTIHGFAQRMLTDHAFESGAPFEAELLGDEHALRRAAVEDFWRRRFYDAPDADVAWAADEWGTPETLYAQIAGLLGRDAARLLPADAGGEAMRLAERWQALCAAARAAWDASGEAAAETLRASPALNRRTYNAKAVETALDAFAAWIEDAAPVPGRLPERIELFTPDKLAAATKKGQETPTGTLFERCGELVELAPRLARARRAALVAEAVDYARGAVDEHKRARSLLSYDDLLTRLDAVLVSADGAVLAARIRARYPVAMIDEFQDTDPVQYRIFSAVYAATDEPPPASSASAPSDGAAQLGLFDGIEEPDRREGRSGKAESGEEAELAAANEHSEAVSNAAWAPRSRSVALFMIGDPKQAIYGFRGADIFAYLTARKTAAEAYTLGTNWRSSSALVDAVNRVFARREKPFLFEGIEFHPAAPSPRADDGPLVVEGVQPPPLACWWLPNGGDKPLGSGAAKAQAAAACAHEIARLLGLAAAGQAAIGEAPLAAGDLAVLVRNRYEADEIRSALAAVGVASVFLARESIFDTLEAVDLRHLLRAAAEPGDTRALRAALATDLLGVDAAALDALNRDEAAWETWLDRFHGAQQRWREHGFMPMFAQLMTDCAIAHRLLAEPDGERRMTNLLQLAELLAEESGRRRGFEALLRWLDECIADPDGDDEQQQLRLESDESLVQVVTVHASKGLEYPLVFLPFPWAAKPFKADERPILFHAESDFAACADLGSEAREDHAKLAERERLAEDLRLLYVALTRAQRRVYLSWGRVAGADASALGWLLHGGQGIAGRDDVTLRDELLALDGGSGRLALLDLPAGAIRAPAPPLPAVQQARHFAGRIDAGWRVTSYSGLVAGHGERAELPDYDAVAADEAAPPARPQRDAFAFPRGAQAGLFLHALLEKLDFPEARGETLAQAVRAGLALHGFETEWQPAVEALIGRVLDTPLDETGLCLREVARADRRDELAFYYPLAPLGPGALNELLARDGALALDGERLAFNPLRGMMKGYIDLVFRRDRRYYLVDYKSNHLGDRAEDYAPPRLAEAMREHRYDLQYLIYCVALHRHLRARLPGYDYARDFGGVFYLFLRGMRPADGPRLGVYRDRPEPALVDALDALFAGGERAA
ncbi:hypothetical protein BJI67_02225 [Acidihalobacter aeolianus]|uniref:RecBCD enzyme subunit RecB n=1 Tax=Acidihalobacter aeolianus TaxID=2792603 RepID=A0A1D8K506_9GAMM|nr:UvrD-helicase domain-containing protein [Acidihalobacter aeolianus]AOV16043.1 hypothetical protein BJI67_02225 [Acidihalobacter aeolianus]